MRAWSLLFAATVLYLPANIFPILTVIRFGRGEPSTIMQGVIELMQARMWPLAALVFLASILVPLIKLLSLTTMLLTTHSGSAWRLCGRTRLYRFVESIGRWSMIDVFMLTVLVALVHMGFLATVLPGPGCRVLRLRRRADDVCDPGLRPAPDVGCGRGAWPRAARRQPRRRHPTPRPKRHERHRTPRWP